MLLKYCESQKLCSFSCCNPETIFFETTIINANLYHLFLGMEFCYLFLIVHELYLRVLLQCTENSKPKK